jgi:adenylyltransferase/sulfurtransferase
MRYQRQIILPEVGLEGQERLGRARILVVGAGGLGCPALLYLAATGVGTLGIVDDDSVEISNLHRQVLYDTDDLGRLKVEVAHEKLIRINPDLKIHIYPVALSSSNIQEIIQSYDIILDGTDNFATKFMLNDATFKYKKVLIYGAIQGFDGQVGVFRAGNSPCYRCLYPEPPKFPIQNCAQAGVIGPVAGMIGLTQAIQAIQLIAQHDSYAPLIGKLWTIDLRTMASHVRHIPTKPDCRICQADPTSIILHEEPTGYCTLRGLSVDAAQQLHPTIWVDVRETPELQNGKIHGAMEWPLSLLQKGYFPDLPSDHHIVLYCQRGMRSQMAASLLKSKGYVHVHSLEGGFDVWNASPPKAGAIV